MYNGLWTVEFISINNRFGKGVIVLSGNPSNGRLLGGDSAYYYSGHYNIINNIISANVIIIKYNPVGTSVFGDLDSFNLSINGEIDKLHFSAVGTISNMPHLQIKIIANKKEDF